MSLPPENALKTECIHGHSLSADNLLLLRRRDGRIERVCRTCARRRIREFRERHYVPHPRPRRIPGPKPPQEPRPARDLRPPQEPKPRPRRAAYLRVLDRTTIIEGGCWLWQGALNHGYGIIQLGRKPGEGTARVHRVIYEHFIGPLEMPPPLGPDVMHSCHVRNCVNPAHLVLGTRAENMASSQRDGRLRRH